MRQLPTAAEAAIIIAVCAKRKELDLGKELNRIRLSEITFKKLIGRSRMDGRFVDDLNESLRAYNWHLVMTDGIGLLKASSVKGWPRMISEPVRSEIKEARRGLLDYERLERELDASRDDDEDDDEG